MKNRRKEQVGEAIRTEISEMLVRELRDPRLGFVTITDVEVTTDLRYARVYISVLGSSKEKATSLLALQHASGFIRTQLSHRIALRYMPELSFRLDESIERADRIMQLLREAELSSLSLNILPAQADGLDETS
jgi:ribosome-binding factor A